MGAEFFLGEQRLALVVERPAIGLHIVEPDVVGTAGVGPGEDKNRGRDACVGLEDAAGQRNDRIEFLLLDQQLPNALVRLARSEQHAVRDDDGCPATRFQEPQEESDEEKLGLLGLDDLLKVLGAVLVVKRSGSRGRACSGRCRRSRLRSMVLSKSKPWNMPRWKCARSLASLASPENVGYATHARGFARAVARPKGARRLPAGGDYLCR
jgi:hypothetical protein